MILNFLKCEFSICSLLLVRIHREVRGSPGVNFINILRTLFSYEIALRSFFLVTFWQKKHFCTKNTCIKCWWIWHLYKENIFIIRGMNIMETNEMECKRFTMLRQPVCSEFNVIPQILINLRYKHWSLGFRGWCYKENLLLA